MASNPENVRFTVLMKLQEALMKLQEALDEMLALMHRFADRFTDRRVEINNLMVLHDHPLIDYGKYALGCMTGADIKKCVKLKGVRDELLRSMEEKRQLMMNYKNMVVSQVEYPSLVDLRGLFLDLVSQLLGALSQIRSTEEGLRLLLQLQCKVMSDQPQKPDKVVRVFLSMHEYGFQQDLSSLNMFLDVLCKSRRVEMAYNLFKVLKRRFRFPG
ncbi:probable 3-hydroxyisobutyrate dehydrogenase-like 1, mitochondrial [Tanacetum coccineum]